MEKIAFIFPGQGAQKTGMGLDLYNNFDASKNVFETCNKTLGRDIKGLCFEGSEEELKLTINSQIAILATSIAALEAFRSKTSLTPCYCAGHSLGEYSAMYAAGVMDLKTVFLAIQKRAELMHEASLNNKGTMAAVLGLDSNKIKEIISNVEGYVDIANYNNEMQTVITGEIKAVEEASNLLKEQGARRVIPLSVSGAFHSALMRQAGDEFEKFVSNLDLSDAKFPVVTNIDTFLTVYGDDFKFKMPKQIYSSVYWYQSIQKMLMNGVDRFIEFGEGNILSGLNKKICPEIKTYSISDSETLYNTLEELK